MNAFNSDHILVHIPYEVSLVGALKKMEGVRWTPDLAAWRIPNRPDEILALLQLLRGNTIHLSPALLQEWRERGPSYRSVLEAWSQRSEMPVWDAAEQAELRKQLQAKGYSPKTLKAYHGHVQRLFDFIRASRTPWDEQLLTRYNLRLQENGYSHSYINQAISAITFYLRRVCQSSPLSVDYIRPKREMKLPNVLSLPEVKQLFDAVTNVKHRALLYVTYSSGLRVSEVVRLKPADLDMGRRTVKVRQGKGRKDRYTILSQSALRVLQPYLAEMCPKF